MHPSSPPADTAQQTDDALQQLAQAVALHPDRLPLWQDYLDAMAANGHYGLAAAKLKRLGSAHLPPATVEQLWQQLAQAAGSQGNEPGDTDVADYNRYKWHGNFDEALDLIAALTFLYPHSPQCWEAFAGRLCHAGRYAEAVSVGQQAVRLNPTAEYAHINLGVAYKHSGMLNEAEACYRQALQINPHNTDALNNLGNIRKDLGYLEEAEPYYRAALAVQPDYFTAHSNLLFSANYLESLPPQEAFAQARASGLLFSQAAADKYTAWAQPQDGRLNVGWISGDFCNHPVGYFLQSLLPHLDRTRFTLHAFPTTPVHDSTTDTLKRNFDHWQPLLRLPPQETAARIHAQDIQILIDLSGHSAHNALTALAYRPAPVQASWLGYFATTGLPEMDYFIGDPYLSPPGTDCFSETLFNLAESWLCFTPPEYAPPPSDPPCLHNGYPTFGSFGNLSKLNDRVLTVWAALLQRLPHAKLMLKARQLSETAVRNRLTERCARFGIDSSRLIIDPPSERKDYLSAYHRVDLMLDTFPYPGGTTSCEALWMGVPVLTLSGSSFLSRLGHSVAANAGLHDWIAYSEAEYIDKAAAFAARPDELAALRHTLRQRLPHTPLFDAPRFARHFGTALEEMYRQKCTQAV